MHRLTEKKILPLMKECPFSLPSDACHGGNHDGGDHVSEKCHIIASVTPPLSHVGVCDKGR